MRLTDSIHIVASGDSGFSLTNAFDCTVYLVDCGSSCVLIDAGMGVEPELILREIQAAGFAPEQVSHILLTHGHGDHAGGAAALSARCNAAVYAMEPAAGFIREGNTDALSLTQALEAGVFERSYVFTPCDVQPLTAGHTLRIGDKVFEVVAAEGHCAGHCCFLVEENAGRVLFSGDAIQCGGKIALQAIWDCDLQKYVDTVRRLGMLHPDVLLPGHGCVALNRGWKHIERANTILDTLALPKNSIGE